MIQWLTEAMVLHFHRELIQEHGGAPGLRDKGLLEAALARPQQLHAYESQTDVGHLAAAYAYGISRNHPFLDGNKRIALMALYVFLRLNGFRLIASEAAATVTFLELAAGKLSEEALMQWVHENLEEL